VDFEKFLYYSVVKCALYMFMLLELWFS